MAITEKQRTDYLQAPSHCPWCKSDNIEADHIKGDGGSAWGDVKCYNCGKEWKDVYTLTDVEEKGDLKCMTPNNTH